MISQKPKLFHIVLILIAMTILHLVANATGLYEQPVIWIDKVLHIMAGLAIAMLWFWFLQRKENFTENIPKIILVSSAIGFVSSIFVGGSRVWILERITRIRQ